MISVTGQAAIAEIQRKLTLLPAAVEDELGKSIEAFLTAVEHDAPAQTPWRQKPKGHESDPHMQDVYTSELIPSSIGVVGKVLNQRFYAGWVGRTGNKRQKPNARLKAWLEHKDAEADVLLSQAVTRRVAALMR